MLLAPHHARERLTLNISQIINHGQRANSVIELIGLFSSLFNDVVKLLFVQVRLVAFGEAEADN